MKLEFSISRFENNDIIATSCGRVDGFYFVFQSAGEGKPLMGKSILTNGTKSEATKNPERTSIGIYHIVNGNIEKNICPDYEKLLEVVSKMDSTTQKEEIQKMYERFCKEHGFDGIVGI